MESALMNDKVKQALPYVAVLGISALAVYGIAKIVKTLNEVEPFNFDRVNKDIDWDKFV
jgi:hypothetical protein